MAFQPQERREAEEENLSPGEELQGTLQGDGEAHADGQEVLLCAAGQAPSQPEGGPGWGQGPIPQGNKTEVGARGGKGAAGSRRKETGSVGARRAASSAALAPSSPRAGATPPAGAAPTHTAQARRHGEVRLLTSGPQDCHEHSARRLEVSPTGKQALERPREGGEVSPGQEAGDGTSLREPRELWPSPSSWGSRDVLRNRSHWSSLLLGTPLPGAASATAGQGQLKLLLYEGPLVVCTQEAAGAASCCGIGLAEVTLCFLSRPWLDFGSLGVQVAALKSPGPRERTRPAMALGHRKWMSAQAKE